jgi:hypothetical protein
MTPRSEGACSAPIGIPDKPADDVLTRDWELLRAPDFNRRPPRQEAQDIQSWASYGISTCRVSLLVSRKSGL